MTTKVQIGLAAATLGAATLLTGCGGDDSDGGGDFADQPGEDIANAAKSAMQDLTSMKVVGDITSDDDKVELDLQLSTDADCTGTIGTSGATIELLGVDGNTWMRPDEAFWKTMAGSSGEQMMNLVGDKWVVVPSSEDTFTQFCDLDELLDQMIDDDDDSDSTYTVGDTSEIDGQSVVAVDSKDDDGNTSTGYVEVDEPHRLVKIELSGDDSGTLTFSEFDEDIDVTAPAEDDTVDLSSITG